MPAPYTPRSPPLPQEALYTKRPAQVDLINQTIEVPGSKRPGQTAHYRNALFPDWNVLLEAPKPQTLHELVLQVTDEVPNANALGYLPVASSRGVKPIQYSSEYKWILYGEAAEIKIEVASAFMHFYRSGALGDVSKIERIDPHAGREVGWGVGLWSANRPEWQLADWAAGSVSLVSVALYDTLGPSATEYVANHAGLPIIVTSVSHLPSLLKLLPKVNSVKVVVCMEPLVGEELEMARSWAQESGVFVCDWDELRSIGRANPSDAIPPRRETVSTLSYTSGTTGNPKGVILTHGAITSAVIANAYNNDKFEQGWVFCSYLPLAHVYGRFCDLVSVYLRGSAAYTTGDPLRLIQDIQLIKPHFFPSVPRVLNRLYAAIMAQANAGGVKANLLKHAINVKLENFRKTGQYTHAFYDRIVFSKLQALLGGRVAFIGSGSAPISPLVFETLKVCFAVDMVEGWGMTETVGTGTVGWSVDPGATGKIGIPRICNEVKLVDVPEMGYLATDKPHARGELCVRGLNLFNGYYKDEKNTKEALDSEGWMHTGDVAAVDSVGRIQIIDRKKNIMKLAQGEYVAVETVEGTYLLCPLFSTFFLYGDSLRTHLVGVGVVDAPTVLPWLQKTPHLAAQFGHVKTEAQLRALVEGQGKESKVLRKEIVKVLRKLAREKKLQGYEHVKGIHLVMDPFPADLLTPSFKFKRAAVSKHFSAGLAKAYDESEEPDEQSDKVKARL